MNETERQLLQPLALMVAQYLVHCIEDTELDSMAINAGENALTVLADYGLVALKGRHRIRGDWTDVGRQFLEDARKA